MGRNEGGRYGIAGGQRKEEMNADLKGDNDSVEVSVAMNGHLYIALLYPQTVLL